jgi:hypothetical protein
MVGGLLAANATSLHRETPETTGELSV